ncbi:MAG TPA: NPCBM/NEW2 domain-containing protein [Pseudonocardiaceae bacterium]|jgi:hypothetical protein
MIVAEMSLTTSPNSPSGKRKWHSKPWWTALGVIVAICAAFIGLGTWLFPRSSDDGKTTGAPNSSVMPSPSPSGDPTGPIPGASPTSSNPGQPTGQANQVFLSDIPDSNFIRQPSSPKRGPATVADHTYPSSYSYSFSNCSNCTYEVEVNLPGQYKRFKGTFSLTDQTHHDNVIDGIVYFSICSSAGSPLLQPQKVEYPDIVPFDIDVAGVSRVRLTVSNGTNSEYPCWCDAQFTQ